MTIIALPGQSDGICRRYPEYWHSDGAQREFQTLWGGADCNDCGVFERHETIRVDLDCHKSWYGEVRIAIAPNGWHAIATSYWYGQGGGGSRRPEDRLQTPQHRQNRERTRSRKS